MVGVSRTCRLSAAGSCPASTTPRLYPAVEEIVARLGERRVGARQSLPSGRKSVIVRRILPHIDLRHLLLLSVCSG
jgi:hypothetical protein